MTFETGQYVSQIVHFTQWSSDSRISSGPEHVLRVSDSHQRFASAIVFAAASTCPAAA